MQTPDQHKGREWEPEGSQVIKHRCQRARRTYRCGHCGLPITDGSLYERAQWIQKGKYKEEKYHLVCWEVRGHDDDWQQ